MEYDDIEKPEDIRMIFLPAQLVKKDLFAYGYKKGFDVKMHIKGGPGTVIRYLAHEFFKAFYSSVGSFFFSAGITVINKPFPTASAEILGSNIALGSTYTYAGTKALGMTFTAPDSISINEMYAHAFPLA